MAIQCKKCHKEIAENDKRWENSDYDYKYDDNDDKLSQYWECSNCRYINPLNPTAESKRWSDALLTGYFYTNDVKEICDIAYEVLSEYRQRFDLDNNPYIDVWYDNDTVQIIIKDKHL